MLEFTVSGENNTDMHGSRVAVCPRKTILTKKSSSKESKQISEICENTGVY